jgi:uncharacterized protein YqjF (DUF2071 family)
MLERLPGTTSRGTRTWSQSPRIAERGLRTLIPIPGPRVAVRGLRLRVHVSRNAVPGLCFRSLNHESRYADFVSESTYRGTRSPDFDPDPGTTRRGTRTSSQSPRIAGRGPRTLLPIPGPRDAVRGFRLRVRVSWNAVSGLCFRSRDHETRYADFVSESTYRGTRSPDFDSDPGTMRRGTRTSSQSPRIAERGPGTLLPIPGP